MRTSTIHEKRSLRVLTPSNGHTFNFHSELFSKGTPYSYAMRREQSSMAFIAALKEKYL